MEKFIVTIVRQYTTQIEVYAESITDAITNAHAVLPEEELEQMDVDVVSVSVSQA